MITQFEKDILKKIEKGEKKMKKIIALEKKGFLEKGQELYEWDEASKSMDKNDKDFFKKCYDNNYYYFMFMLDKKVNKTSWLSIPKSDVKVEIIETPDVIAPSEAQVKSKNLNEVLDDTTQIKPKFKVGDKVMFKDDGEKEIFEIEKVDVSICYELKGDKYPLLGESLLVPAPTTKRYFNVYKWLEDTIKRGRDAKYIESYFSTMMKIHGELAKNGAENYPEWCDEK